MSGPTRREVVGEVFAFSSRRSTTVRRQTRSSSSSTTWRPTTAGPLEPDDPRRVHDRAGRTVSGSFMSGTPGLGAGSGRQRGGPHLSVCLAGVAPWRPTSPTNPRFVRRHRALPRGASERGRRSPGNAPRPSSSWTGTSTAPYVTLKRTRRVERDTVFVFTSDNGYLLGEHRLMQAKVRGYEASLEHTRSSSPAPVCGTARGVMTRSPIDRPDSHPARPRRRRLTAGPAAGVSLAAVLNGPVTWDGNRARAHRVVLRGEARARVDLRTRATASGPAWVFARPASATPGYSSGGPGALRPRGGIPTALAPRSPTDPDLPRRTDAPSGPSWTSWRTVAGTGCHVLLPDRLAVGRRHQPTYVATVAHRAPAPLRLAVTSDVAPVGAADVGGLGAADVLHAAGGSPPTPVPTPG